MSLRDFHTLKPEEVLMLAIDVEDGNRERLSTFAALFADYVPEVAGVLSQMASQEDEHHDRLEKMYQKRYGTLQRMLGEEEVREVVEAHDLDDAEHLVFDSLSLRRVLEAILVVERQAQAFYQRALQSTAEPELRALYQELGDYEDLHIQRVEKMLEELGGLA